MARSGWINGFLGLVVIGGVSASAYATPNRFWNNSNGSATYWDWANGGDDNGLFGDPLLVNGDTFLFFPSNFRAASAGQGQVTKSDRIEVQIFAHPNVTLGEILITEFGDYQITGSNGSVDVGADLRLSEIGGLGRLRTNTMNNEAPPMPQTTGAGPWDGSVAVDLSFDFPEWTALTLELTDTLIAIAAPGTSASIEKTLTGAAVGITIIPEPASVALLALGACGLIGRRRGK